MDFVRLTVQAAMIMSSQTVGACVDWRGTILDHRPVSASSTAMGLPLPGKMQAAQPDSKL